MAVTISKKARSVLNKEEKRVERETVAAPRVKEAKRDPLIRCTRIEPLPSPLLQPSSMDPNKSVLAALWQMPGRPGETLMIVRRGSDRMYRVVDYNPVTGVAVLEHRRSGVTNPNKEVETFDTHVGPRTEEQYAPFWR